MAKASIKVEGVAATVRAIKEFEPEVYKAMGKSFRASVRTIRDTARAKRGEAVYKASTQLTSKRGPSASVSAVMGPQSGRNDWSSPQTRSVIFEKARKSAHPQMQAAIRSFNDRYGTPRGNKADGGPGRFLYAAFDDIGPSVERGVEREIRDAERKLQAKLNAAGEGY